MKTNNLIKVNIGSGPHGRADWVSLDWGILPLLSKIPMLRQFLINLHLLPKQYSKSWPNTLRLYDCRRRLPFSDNSVNYIYTSHFLEHLAYYQAVKLLAECKRVLCPSGILRIVVPDLRLLAEKYIQSDTGFFLTLENTAQMGVEHKSLADVFVQHFWGCDCWSEPTFVQKLQRRFIRGHLWMYDYESLSDILHRVGFTKVQRYEPAQGRVPDIEYLDIHRIGSLFVEASSEGQI